MSDVLTSDGVSAVLFDGTYPSSANAVCPKCGVDMRIANRYNRGCHYEGKSNLAPHQCLKCNEIVVPIGKDTT